MGFFGPKVEYELQRLKDRDVTGTPEPSDYPSLKELKRRVADSFKNYACPSCGNRRIQGSNIVVTYEKLSFYRQVSYKGWFGGTKYKDVLYATVWRVCDMGYKPGREAGWIIQGIEPGKMECTVKGCGWKQEGPRAPAQSVSEALGIQWFTVNDILAGKPWKQ